MKAAATIARIAMWIMIGAIVLGFFIRSNVTKVVWAVAALVCIVCMLIVAFGKNRRRS